MIYRFIDVSKLREVLNWIDKDKIWIGCSEYFDYIVLPLEGKVKDELRKIMIGGGRYEGESEQG